ncbi:serine/threonine protein kinase [Ancylothrix sp. C2]|uniref:serine/threonine-protein kinase n=1 Tax=Ancylothrix sp. D3o TaxID=2953691 RepID=UPI0021BB058C|nr:serine/threonine-protein kinase [Ancylothrix sp. D3o]MCT7950862.1 serine/threonine protein kinase [Ancylothrix sp. D3o]
MTFCLNPSCPHPKNRENSLRCVSCGSKLLLRERYRAIQPIGEGGFGITYLAVDEDRLSTRCVIKQFVPKIEGTDSRAQASLQKAIQLFNQEALRLCELGEHRQIPTLLAFFEQNRRLYLVQEYIDGNTLWDELHEGAFNEPQIRQVLMSMLQVLKFIHEHRVIHRDITPTNILRRARDGQLMLIDFGVAKLLSRSEMERTGTRIGTQGYAPLEQMRSGKAYPASDIYSLGVTCLHLLTRVKPDNLFDPLKGWVWRDVLAKQGRSVTERLGQVLDKMVQEMVRDRYQTAAEVLADLSEGVVSSPPNSASKGVPQKNLIETGERVSYLPPVSVSASKPVSRGWRCIHTLKNHSSWVTSLAIGSNNLMVASGSLDDTIKLWNINTGELFTTLFGHLNAVNSVAFTPDGTLLASCSDDGTIKLWNPSKGVLVATLKGHLRDINSVAISADGKLLASGSEDRTVKLWDLTKGFTGNDFKPMRIFSGRSGMIKCVTFSPKAERVASGGLDNNIYIWNVANGDLLSTLSGHFNSINTLAISPDGNILASGSKDQTIKIWDISKNNPMLLRSLTGHTNMVNSVVFSPQGNTLISGSSDNTIKLWQVSTGKLIGSLVGHLGGVNVVVLAPDGKTILSGSSDKTIKIWRWFA